MLTKMNRNQRGFTLIELMIVVVIIGILAALAIPRFMRATTKSKQSEAKQILKQIYTMQQTYRQQNDEYWDPAGAVAGSATGNAFAELGVEIAPTARYSYSIGGLTATTFLATATVANPGLDDDATADTWTINQDGTLLCTVDDSVL
ncbi:MAG: type II secretion system protein [bacterium]|nr:type II secretion system protein [bacterium]